MTLPIIGGLLVGFSVGAVVGWMSRSAAAGNSPVADPETSPEEQVEARAALTQAREALAAAEERARVAEAMLAAESEAGGEGRDYGQLKLKHDVLAQRVREAEAALEICQDRCNRFRERADIADALDKQLKTARDRVADLEGDLARSRGAAPEAPPTPPIDGPTLLPDDVPLSGEPMQPQPDDLRSIPGVGPKIERLLRANGVQTFAQLAACTPDQVRKYLVQGGAHMAKYDPEPWIADAGTRASS